jgi:endonuclease-3
MPAPPPVRPTRPHRERAARILDVLEKTYPDADTELRYRNAFELVVATILSAQCTDERVNQVTPVLFGRYPTAETMAKARPAQIEAIIRSTGFFRAKTKSILGCAKALMADHGGVVPRTMEAMVKLPGVGRKTSSVVIGHAYGVAEGIAVDTHVLRVSNRLGIARGDDPIEVERQLMALIPPERWIKTTDLLIFHGRRTCQARRPDCGRCPVFSLCRWPYRQAFALGQTPKVARARAARAR